MGSTTALLALGRRQLTGELLRVNAGLHNSASSLRACAALRTFATDEYGGDSVEGVTMRVGKKVSGPRKKNSGSFNRERDADRRVTPHGDDGRGEKTDRRMRTIQRVAPMSPGLRELYDAVAKGDGRALDKYKEVGKKAKLSAEEMELLADTIEFYFSMAPAAATSVDGLRVADRNALKALYKILRAHVGSAGRDAAIPGGMPISSPVEKTVVNTAPVGRIPWQIMGVNEDKATIWWGVDLTGGKAKDPWSNGRLSLAAKDAMYRAYKSDPERYTPKRLAQIFRVREQRAMAIVRLKEMEARERGEKVAGAGGGEDVETSSSSVASEVARVMERALQCTQGIGADERHHVELPSFPAYAEVGRDEVIGAIERVLGKSISDITVEDITADVAKQVLGIKSLREMEEIVAKREESQLVEEFRERLDFNTSFTGGSISRDSRRTKAVRRPKDGWSLVVTPIGKESKAKHERFVAMPDGSRRELNADELLYVARKTPKKRRKVL